MFMPFTDASILLSAIYFSLSDEAREQNRPDLAEAEAAQAAVIEEYLPQPLTPEELETALREIIAQVGATSPKDMGKVMGVASKQLAGKADGKAISTKVKELLAQ